MAQTIVGEDGTETRYYPYGSMFAHAVGYDSNGKSGIESFGNFSLLRSHAFFLEQVLNGIQDKKNQGDNIVTTLDWSEIKGRCKDLQISSYQVPVQYWRKKYCRISQKNHTENYKGVAVKNYKSSAYGALITTEEAQKLQGFMSKVVSEGTGSKLSGQSYQAAGKTGSAEFSNNKEERQNLPAKYYHTTTTCCFNHCNTS